MGGLTSAALWSGVLQLATLILILALLYRPLGDYIAHSYQSRKDLRIERGLYRLIGVDPASAQTWQAYLRGVLVFSATGVLFVYALQRLQAVLPYALGLPSVPEGLAFNTAVSFVTNTNWQSYSPELTMGYTVQFAGLAVQNFVSAAVGIAVAIALVRGFAARRSDTLGNFWVDLVRGTFRLLLPLSIVAAIALLAAGVVQNFNGFTEVHTITGGTQVLPGGPVASQEAIKELGTNGGGFFNANSAHPFENPTPWSTMLEILLLLAIPFALPRAFGRMVGDNRQGYAILGVMAAIFLVSVTVLSFLEASGQGAAPELAGSAMEGKEQRFGIFGSTLFAGATTLTSTGAVNSMHDSFTALGGMLPMINMMLGEVAPGGTGSGLYGMLVLAVIAVFVGGLLVGRTPEYLGKKIGPQEIKLASLYILVTPALVLMGTALSFAVPGVRDDVESVSIWNPGAHGLSEVLYAFTSAANNNGSAFAGLTANTPWLNTVLGITMLLGRFVPMVLVLALAGSLAKQDVVPSTAGTLPTYTPQFAGLLAGVAIIVTALTYFPVLTLGPLAEGLV
ncbi:potassium-transporting ATPase subunit KdpA [Microbacterium sp. P5_E9]